MSGFAAPGLMLSQQASAQGTGLQRDIKLTSVSWIDKQNLPVISMWSSSISALRGYWPTRVMMGLIATSNDRPPKTLTSDFYGGTDFRALITYRLKPDSTFDQKDLNPGFTPEFDPTKLVGDTLAKHLLPTSKLSKGQKSALSQVVTGALHPNSSLSLPEGAEVLSSALIKFRAGPETNERGIGDGLTGANSPFHVPWVWCEHAVIRRGDSIRLITNGSRFPSHAWYLDDKRVHTMLQKPVKMSEKEPAFTSGAPKDKDWGKPEDDKSTKPITKHAYTVEANKATQIETVLPL